MALADLVGFGSGPKGKQSGILRLRKNPTKHRQYLFPSLPWIQYCLLGKCLNLKIEKIVSLFSWDNSSYLSY